MTGGRPNPDSDAMKVPSTEFLESIERSYSVRYPEPFKALCARLATTTSDAARFVAAGGRFIVDLETFWAVNTRVGEEQWGDYERAIVGARHPKDRNRLWGGILPFFVDDSCVYGFSADGKTGERVHVWSVHTLVHSYPSLADFAEAQLRI